jgi:hypothetical protein
MFSRLFRARSTPSARITLTDAGFAVEGHRSPHAAVLLEWSAVDRVEAFKRDLYALDLICLELRARGSWVEVNEEMEGWDLLLSAMHERLPGALDQAKLYAAVMQPPFAECRTVVFERSD